MTPAKPGRSKTACPCRITPERFGLLAGLSWTLVALISQWSNGVIPPRHPCCWPTVGSTLPRR